MWTRNGSERRVDPIVTATALRGILAASLSLECEALTPGKRGVTKLSKGMIVRTDETDVVLRFEISDRDDAPPAAGASGYLHLEGQQPRWARVEEYNGRTLTVTLRGSPDDLRRDAHFVEDPRWILESARGALLRRIPGRHDHRALEMLGFPPAVLPVGPSHGSSTSISWLNEEQRRAVAESVRPGVLWLHGPPGTGKTTAVAAIVNASVALGRRTLAVAPSNAAVDALATKVCGALQDHDQFRDGLVVRHGRMRDQVLRGEWGAFLEAGQIARRRVRAPLGSSSSALAKIEARVLAACRVLLTTTSQTHLTRALETSWDLVVIDEAAMVSLPVAYHIASLTARDGVLVLAGDYRQLPTVSRSHHPVARAFHATCPWTVRGFENCDHGDPEGSRVVRLTQQHRMDAPISDLVSSLTYEGRLVTARSVERRSPLGPPLSGDHLLLLDSSGGGQQLGDRAFHRADAYHSELAVAAAKWIVQESSENVAVLSRYRTQVCDVLRRMGSAGSIFVGTVHGVQGREFDTVVLMLSLKWVGSTPGDFLTGIPPSAVGARLLNTAVSRARRRLVLLADVTAILACPAIPHEAMVRQILEYCIAHGRRIEPADIPGFFDPGNPRSDR